MLLSLVCGGVLLAAAALKLASPAAARVALGTYADAVHRPADPHHLKLADLRPVPWMTGRAALGVLIATEAAVGAAALAGVAWPAVVLFAAFAGAQVFVLARGGGGAPCGCLGGRGTVGWAGVARAAALAGAAAFAPGGPLAGSVDGHALTDAPSAAARVVVVAAALVIAGVAAFALHRAPDGALDVADEGPPLGSFLDLPAGVALFTAEGCSLCARVKRGLDDYTELDEERDAAVWLAARVPGAPYAVVVGDDGRVEAKGTVNTAAQVRSLSGASSRRSFLGRAAGAAAAVAGADAVGSLVRPGEAEAYHFCGHIYTTDSCPHPTGLPRIDSKGYPLRARDGHRVDDLGRPVDREGRPVDNAGHLLVDPDGRPLPVASRTRVCDAVGTRFGFASQTDGAWYRCCKGHVRKLVDCCSTSTTRINGDASLTGYCYGGRRVFCVMFFQTKVKC